MTTNGNVDPFDGSKSRKSSGFSDGTNGGGSKSRQYSGYDLQNKSRNCSGNSISAGLVSSGTMIKISYTNNNKLYTKCIIV